MTLLAVPLLCALADETSAVIGSKHDLSVTGAGPVTSSQADACGFCHGSHLAERDAPKAGQTPLWNRTLPVLTYDIYSSSTYDSGEGELSSNVSKLCLSCHDGTIAPGQLLSRGPVATRGSLRERAMGSGTLAADHPVGIKPVDDGQLAPSLFEDPPHATDPAVSLFEGRMECTSCHNPHEPARDKVARKFLVRSNRNGALCLACHDPGRPQPNVLSGWFLSVHATATNTIQGDNRYGAVGANACLNCHAPHAGAGMTGARLLRAREELVCMTCHQGSTLSPPIADVGQQFAKLYSHPTATVGGAHDPAGDGFPVATDRHAECSDCHNPHATGSSGAVSPPLVPTALRGASGYDGSVALIPAAHEYEVCYKCHADSPNKPQADRTFSNYGRTPRRQTDLVVADPFNTRLEFESLVSRHNVSSPRSGSGSNEIVPSLRPAIRYPNGQSGRSLSTGSYIYCTDCHNSDAAHQFGGPAPNGPHGSNNPHLLAQSYPLNPQPVLAGDPMGSVGFASGAGTYGLCNMCHFIDRAEHSDAILNDRTFEHRKHVEEKGLSCANCHDPHGVQGGNPSNNPSLINFDLDVVAPLQSFTEPRLERSGVYRGSCYLTCHGVDHSPMRY